MTIKSSDAFKYLWINWRMTCIHPWSKYKAYYKLYFIVFNSLSFSVTLQIVFGLFFSNSLQNAVQRIPFAIGGSISLLKFLSIYSLRYELMDLKGLFKALDRKMNTAQDQAELKTATKGAQFVYFFYTIMMAVIMFNGAMASFFSKMQNLMVPAWYPFDYTSSLGNYLLAFSHQFIGAITMAAHIVSMDSLPPAYLIVLNAHIRSLIRRISEIGLDKKVGDENYKILTSCIQDHLVVMKIFYILQKNISRILFYQFIVTSVLLCVNTIYIMSFNPPTAEVVFYLTYAFVNIFQALPSCYFANRTLNLGEEVGFAAYDSNWPYQSRKYCKAICMIIRQAQVPYIILAGGIVPVTQQTFLSIVRFAYSLIALLANQL